MNASNNAAVLEDRDRLEHWLAERGFVPYVHFEILTVVLEDGELELDPLGNLALLLPALESFASTHDFAVAPFDPETGTVSLRKSSGA